MAICGVVSLGVGIPAEGLVKAAKEGGSILVAVLVAAFFMVVTELWSNKMLVSLNNVIDAVEIGVVRGGRHQQVPVSNIVVGDQVPCHGLVIEQHSLKLNNPADSMNRRFLLSDEVVVDGFCSMLVTTVGVKKSGRKFREEGNLKRQLKGLDSVTKIVCYLLMFLCTLPILDKRTFTTTDEEGKETNLGGIAKINAIFGVLVSVIQTIINIPDPWELSLTLTKAYATKQLKAGNNTQVFNHNALETMSYATVICTDKTGVVATDQIKVAEFWQPFQGFVGEESIDPKVKELLQKGIALDAHRDSTSEFETFGSLSEKAILSWAVNNLKTDSDQIKMSHNVTDVLSLDSYSSILAREIEDGVNHIHLKGSPELVLSMCLSYYDSSGATKSFDDDDTMRSRFEGIVRGMEESDLTCVAFAHKQVHAEMDKLETSPEDLILIGVVGISNPCHEGIKSSARNCHLAQVKLKLITEDNICTAKAIASECGILREGEEEQEVIQGKDFRNYSEEERMEKVDSIRVMGAASRSDKLLMVRCLKEKGHVVVVVGGDLAGAEEADMAMATASGGASKADILTLDDGLSSVLQVLKWGRCLYRNIQKFSQFRLTATVVCFVVNLSAVCSGYSLKLMTVQLLWLSLVTDTLGALAFATLKPTEEVLEMMRPVRRNCTDLLVTNVLLRNITLQSLYQIALVLYFLFRDFDTGTFFFNLFVLFRVFSGLSARELEAKNIFRRIPRNGLFLAIFGFSLALQVMFVEIFQELADTRSLSWLEWDLCFEVAFFTLPVGWVARLIPVPEKQVVWILVRIKSRIKSLIPWKLRSLYTWASMDLAEARSRVRPRRGFIV